MSGSGRTLQNFIDVISAGELDARIAVVIADRPEIKGIQRAQDAGLKAVLIPRKGTPPDQFSRRITDALTDAKVDLVCLAGFLSLWTIPARFEGRVMNIHPALLPKFGGKGFYGHHVHEAVLKNSEMVSGCTVHFCDNQYDHGPIILQREVPVLPDDTPDTLGDRVFEQELIAYPEAIRLFGADRLCVEGQRVITRPAE